MGTTQKAVNYFIGDYYYDVVYTKKLFKVILIYLRVKHCARWTSAIFRPVHSIACSAHEMSGYETQNKLRQQPQAFTPAWQQTGSVEAENIKQLLKKD